MRPQQAKNGNRRRKRRRIPTHMSNPHTAPRLSWLFFPCQLQKAGKIIGFSPPPHHMQNIHLLQVFVFFNSAGKCDIRPLWSFRVNCEAEKLQLLDDDLNRSSSKVIKANPKPAAAYLKLLSEERANPQIYPVYSKHEAKKSNGLLENGVCTFERSKNS